MYACMYMRWVLVGALYLVVACSHLLTLQGFAGQMDPVGVVVRALGNCP